MKKIAILTINDYNNYGNRLQNYATQEVMKSLNFSVETIVNNTNYLDSRKESNKIREIVNKITRMKELTSIEIYSKVNMRVKNYIYKNKIQLARTNRIKAFKEFSSNNIVETDYTISEANIPVDLSNRYDYFVTGSDQVWNPNFRKGSTIDFLTFASKEKRVAYSPSFGISAIPDQFIANYAAWLSEIEYLSVREPAGATIIKELTGRDAFVLVDPTLMLSKEQWLSIAKPAINKPKKEYLLTYFLGELSSENKAEIVRIATDKKLEIVNLASLDYIDYYVADPSEFLDYINSASIFMTDSFHGVVFSILLNTPFVVFERIGKTPSMNSRIDNLLSLFKFEERMHNRITNDAHLFNVNYSHVPSILEIEKQKAYRFLNMALKAEESLAHSKN